MLGVEAATQNADTKMHSKAWADTALVEVKERYEVWILSAKKHGLGQ
jgi:hypothetical protein